ncbi:hypothetical protein [Cyanobium sp. Morenito 9A2]|uniref:hypothetical protein n=1 Tax=Cyanobium sp. Morenito 9A2 TaxID=2823718 RepID=UPI0028F41CDA|nr:hypothetical protein [Cyanobium sp. Morenito 9A2]MCP9849950.1 hypothetical protein [Cyanobium sp. Morenito 9A2]
MAATQANGGVHSRGEALMDPIHRQPLLAVMVSARLWEACGGRNHETLLSARCGVAGGRSPWARARMAASDLAPPR